MTSLGNFLRGLLLLCLLLVLLFGLFSFVLVFLLLLLLLLLLFFVSLLLLIFVVASCCCCFFLAVFRFGLFSLLHFSSFCFNCCCICGVLLVFFLFWSCLLVFLLFFLSWPSVIFSCFSLVPVCHFPFTTSDHRISCFHFFFRLFATFAIFARLVSGPFLGAGPVFIRKHYKNRVSAFFWHP